MTTIDPTSTKYRRVNFDALEAGDSPRTVAIQKLDEAIREAISEGQDPVLLEITVYVRGEAGR